MPPNTIHQMYATNHLGGAALFNLLLKRVLIPSKTRVVAVGSMVHTSADISTRDLTGTVDEFSTGKFYANSKLFNTLWSLQVQKRFGPVGVTSNSLHPGAGLFTNLGREDASTPLKVTATICLGLFAPLLWLAGYSQTWHQGGVAELAACEAPEGGLYFHRNYLSTASPTALDEEVQRWLWEETQRLLAEAAATHDLPPDIALAV